MKNKKVLALFLLLIFPASQANAYWVWSPKEGKFVNAEGATQDSAEEQFDYAMKLYREKNLDGARDKFKEILKKYPNSPKAPESQYRLGMIHEESGDYLKAFKVYKSLVETYPQSERFNEVIEREFRIGNVFLSGRKAKLAGLEILPSLPKAVDVFSHIVKNAPYSDFGDKAQYQLGLAYKKWRHYGEAVDAFQAIIDQYPQSPLVSQARYEVAENSFLRSAANTRDQRALDDASKQVTRFLDRYPDANMAEKATQIRQEIDEKNAEKNYRIGLYYENDNYVESALIYYQDVAARYPQTQWGQKAAKKLESLKDPTKYVSQQQTALDDQERALENKLKSLKDSKDEVEKDITRRSLERLKKHQKTLEKDKKDTMDRRKGDLRRREKELKQKYKNLELKKKLLKKNPSEDLKNAIGRWESSLDKEKSELAAERAQLEGWNKELGIRGGGIDMNFLPFGGPGPTELQKIQSIEAKHFFKISEQKKSILEEKETLYKHFSEVSAMLEASGAAKPAAANVTPVSSEKLKSLQEENKRLESELKEKSALYEKHYGTSALSAITGGLKKSIDVLNPFDDSKTLDAQQLLEHQMHLKEQIAAEQNLIQTLSQALDSQLALEEQKRLMEQLHKKEKVDPKELRKATRALERQIRGGYEEIEARHKHKKQLLKELDKELKARESQDPAIIQITRKVSSPVVGAGRLAKAFFVGLPNEDERLTKKAAKSQDTSAIKKLEEQIREESLLMEAKSQEITNQRKELEILKAQGSLSGGYKFRAVFIDVPYMFFDEAIDGAKRLIPKKDREAMLVNRVHNETEKLEKLKAQLKAVDAKIAKLPKDGAAKAEVKEAVPAKAETKPEAGEKVAPKEVLQKEIETLHTKLELQSNEVKQQVIVAEGAKSGKKIVPITNPKQAKKLSKELDEIQDNLADLIRKESKLEKEERSILEKRIGRIDKEMHKKHSQAVNQDLLTEKERMEDRLLQLQTRQDFLTQELKRFEPIETGK